MRDRLAVSDAPILKAHRVTIAGKNWGKLGTVPEFQRLFRNQGSATRLEENRALGLESTAMKWMKGHPYLSVTFAYLLLMILMAVLGGSGLLHFDPEALGRLIGIAWMVSMLGVMLIRAVR